MPNEQIICRIRGLQPWPTAFSYLHGKAWRFLKAELFPDPDNLFFGTPMGQDPKHQAEPGAVTAVIKGKGFTVKTGDGNLLVTGVQPAGKGAISGIDAVNGKLVKQGDLFISDPAFLEGTRDVE
jgi:methionyl-tRNA formyltransferase